MRSTSRSVNIRLNSCTQYSNFRSVYSFGSICTIKSVTCCLSFGSKWKWHNFLSKTAVLFKLSQHISIQFTMMLNMNPPYLYKALVNGNGIDELGWHCKHASFFFFCRKLINCTCITHFYFFIIHSFVPVYTGNNFIVLFLVFVLHVTIRC